METKKELDEVLETQTANDKASEVLENSDSTEEILQEAGLEPSTEEEASAQKELEEAKDRLVRLHADFDNFRKRVQKEREEWYQYASLGLIEKMLPILDNLERALDSLDGQNKEVQGLFSGIVMIHRQLVETLQKEGLESIQAVGTVFDPRVHEAIMQVPVEEGQEDNLVVEELRKGYRFKERVIRPTMVKVAKK